MQDVLVHIPIWVLSVALLAAMLGASWLGRRLRKRQRLADRGNAVGDEFSLTAVLGLLALLIGFTFSLALQRYEERRVLVVKEANAIGTLWLRTDLLDPAHRNALRTLLRSYVEARVAYGDSPSPAEEVANMQRTSELQRLIWEELRDAVYEVRTTPLASLLVSATNDVFDIGTERAASRASHVPGRLVATLVLYCLITAGLIGYQRGRYRAATVLVMLLVVIALSIVVDLDRPSSGAIRVPQQAMLDVQESMRGG